MLINATGSPMTGEKAEEVLNIVQEYTGVDVKFEFVPHDSYDEKQGLVLASPDTMPMIMHVNKLSACIVDAA